MVLTAINPCLLQAQSGTSSALSGGVTDASGAAVPNATVTATDVNTKATRTGGTDAVGHFLFPKLIPAPIRSRSSPTASQFPNRNLLLSVLVERSR
ncbi:carboxypeptidase-like regulatory domain-containing protein [Tunturiibacter gelidiferens]|uniref:carboxypeptidase-like regulatory domain-containing protein n=1 Tax=Tunturiibacter gelidiferens TaxID=3069689 RepID=UPI003D9BD9E1